MASQCPGFGRLNSRDGGYLKFHRFATVLAIASAGPGTLELVGPDGAKRTLSIGDVAQLPHVEVRASAHGVGGTFRGVLVRDLVRLVGAPLGDSLRGPALASYLLVEAADGYRVIYALAELDAGFTDRTIILADSKDGAPLGEPDGPFQLIGPDEKRPARWVRQVTRLSVVRLPGREKQ